MTLNQYSLLFARENLKPLRKKFYELGAFYTGIGYAFSSKHDAFLKQIVSTLPSARIIKLPMGEGQTFDSLKQAYKASFFREKLNELEIKLNAHASSLQLDNLSEESVNASSLPEEKKNFFLTMLEEKESLTNAVNWAEGMEKALSSIKPPVKEIQFICERDLNFFLDDAPETPRLINYLDGDIPKPLIRKGIVGMLVGAGGVGKTHALAQLAISIATGNSWLGKFPIERPGYVFMGLGENADEDIHRLLRKIAKSLFKNSESSTFFEKDPLQEASKRMAVMSVTGADATFVHQGNPTPFFESFLNQLKAREPEEGWSCIILDPISRFLGADAETDNAAATRFISLLEKITLELKGNPTVLFGHHMNKSGIGSKSTDQGAARGSSAITDGVRWQANLDKARKENGDESEDLLEKNQIIFRTVKSNFTAILPEIKLQKDETGCLHVIEEMKFMASKDLNRRIR
ncbi:MAG: helicase RepA family protein [Chlamydiales bacterium]|nr:helicase RepA family protein [Chlamydiales bacterium]MBY0529889.1 helicase RepA family protein [Rhabdochlamydiaceae bacterium]